MILQPQTQIFSRTNSFVRTFNPEERHLSASRLSSTSLKLGKVRSWKFVYRSPKIEQIKCDGPLAFNRQAHKLVVRKLPKFHDQILENDPLKNSKIVENINFFRQQSKNKQDLGLSMVKALERTRVSTNEFEVSRVLVNVRTSEHLEPLTISRSISCTNLGGLGTSRLSVAEGLRSGQDLFKSIVRQEANLLESRVEEARKGQGQVSMAESRYFGGIIGK